MNQKFFDNDSLKKINFTSWQLKKLYKTHLRFAMQEKQQAVITDIGWL